MFRLDVARYPSTRSSSLEGIILEETDICTSPWDAYLCTLYRQILLCCIRNVSSGKVLLPGFKFVNNWSWSTENDVLCSSWLRVSLVVLYLSLNSSSSQWDVIQVHLCQHRCGGVPLYVHSPPKRPKVIFQILCFIGTKPKTEVVEWTFLSSTLTVALILGTVMNRPGKTIYYQFIICVGIITTEKWMELHAKVVSLPNTNYIDADEWAENMCIFFSD